MTRLIPPTCEAEPATLSDILQINEIINHSIANHTANWESDPIDLDTRRAWYDGLVEKGYPVLVLRDPQAEGKIMCLGSLGPFNPKSGYSKTVENMIYCHPSYTSLGLGSMMLSALIRWARQKNMHTMIAAIGSETTASLRLHEKFGFRETGRLREVGWKAGRWQDLIFMQLMLRDPAEGSGNEVSTT